jgi:hypothetical protein
VLGPWDPALPSPRPAPRCGQPSHPATALHMAHRPLSVRRPRLSPPRQSCILLAVAGHHVSLLHSLRRTWKGAQQRLRNAAEPSSDTPVVMTSGMLSGLPGQNQACLKPMQAASTSTSPAPVGVFCSSPVQPGSTAAELSPATPVVRMLSRPSS